MGVYSEFPEYIPDYILEIDISSGVLTIDTGSMLRNPGDFRWAGAAQVAIRVFKNDTFQHTLTVNQATRAISGNTLSVSEDDEVEIRFVFTGAEGAAWDSTSIFRRSAFLTVGATDETFTFDGSNNTMPVPLYDLGFGWDASDNLKVGFSVSSDGGASQDMTCSTRLIGTTPNKESSTTIDLDSASTQTHTSSFDKSDMTDSCEIETYLKSGTGTTRQEDLLKTRFSDKTSIPDWDTSFPTTGVLLNQKLINTGSRMGEP